MPKMDFYLTPDARRDLEAAVLAAGKSGPAGFLTGHIRGGRFIVEGIVPAARIESAADPDLYFELDKRQSGRIIGFFIPSAAAAVRRMFLRPHACGRLILTPMRAGSLGTAWRGFSIEFDGRFALAPCRIVRFGKTTP